MYQSEIKHIWNGVFKIADDIYDEKLLSLKNTEEEETSTEDFDGYQRKPKSFINTLVDPKNGLTEEEIKQEINTLVAAVCDAQLVRETFQLTTRFYLFRVMKHQLSSFQMRC